jgi:hypothetical protein
MNRGGGAGLGVDLSSRGGRQGTIGQPHYELVGGGGIFLSNSILQITPFSLEAIRLAYDSKSDNFMKR